MPKTIVLQPTRNIGVHASLVYELEAKGIDVSEFCSMVLDRHFTGDWGTLDAHDKRMNDDALKDGSRILSRYNGEPYDVYVITDAADENGIRHTTTVLRPEDY